MNDPARSPWHNEAVQLILGTGRTRYLLDVERKACEHCRSGTRTVSIWVSERGRAEAVAWCGRCFNATCTAIALSAERRHQIQEVKSAVSEGRVSPPWRAARLALEDLERRGLL